MKPFLEARIIGFSVCSLPWYFRFTGAVISKKRTCHTQRGRGRKSGPIVSEVESGTKLWDVAVFVLWSRRPRDSRGFYDR